LWLNFGPPVSCCGVNCILGILKRTARPKIEPPKTSVAYHSRGMCKLTYQYDMEALYLVFWICLFFFARSFIRVNSRVLIQLKKYHWTNHSCARTHTHLSRSRSLSPLARAPTSSKSRQNYNYNMPWAYLRSRNIWPKSPKGWKL
jgi:hypothetical protein